MTTHYEYAVEIVNSIIFLFKVFSFVLLTSSIVGRPTQVSVGLVLSIVYGMSNILPLDLGRISS